MKTTFSIVWNSRNPLGATRTDGFGSYESAVDHLPQHYLVGFHDGDIDNGGEYSEFWDLNDGNDVCRKPIGRIIKVRQ